MAGARRANSGRSLAPVVYTGFALLFTLYMSNLGLTINPQLLPAAVLLVSGAGSFLVQRRQYGTRTA